MRFSLKSLALSLLAGQTALAAPLNVNPDADQSVQPYTQSKSANVQVYDSSRQRRSLDVISAFAEHLYKRGTGNNNKPTTNVPAIHVHGPGNTNEGSSKRPASSDGEKPPTKRPHQDDDDSDSLSGWSSSDDSSGEGVVPKVQTLKLPEVDTPEWQANKQAASEKGSKLRRQLQEEIAKRGPDTGDAKPVVTETSFWRAGPDKLSADPYEFKTMKYLFDRFNPDGKQDNDWPTRSIYPEGYTPDVSALLVAGSKENRALSVLLSSKIRVGEDSPSWTEMMLDSARDLLGSKGLATLKWIDRHMIVSVPMKDSNGVILETPNAIEYAYRVLGGTKGKEFTIDFNPAENTPEAEVVNYLAAQTHVARVLQMLKDYPATFGYKQISKLHLRDQSMMSGMLIELDDGPSDGGSAVVEVE